MAPSQSVKIIERLHISPQLGSVPTSRVPLTFFDLPWFLCRPMQRLFFFDLRCSTSDFIGHILPDLTHSLSLSLQHFFPLSAHLVCPPPPLLPHLLFQDDSSIPFTLAESLLSDFNLLISDHPKDVHLLHPFVPKLPPSRLTSDGTRLVPLFALQLTIFPHAGICIGFEFFHVVADGMAINHFIKSWASLFKSRGDLTCLHTSLPSHAPRDAIIASYKLESVLMSELHDWDCNLGSSSDEQLADKIRATYVGDQTQVQKLKNWVSAQCLEYNVREVRVSTFVVVCAITWVNLIKCQSGCGRDLMEGDETYYLGFVADCRQRLPVKLPATYFGNCLAICYAEAKRSELVGEKGLIMAAKAIGEQVREVEEGGVLKGVEKWMSDWKEIAETGRLVTISGSPKLRVYDTDFGWGKPKKSEVVQIDASGAISLSESRNGGGGVEIGLALTKPHMDVFDALFRRQWNHICV